MKVLVPVVIGLLVVGCGKKQHSGKTQAGDNANKPKFTIEEIDELKKKSEAGDGEAMHDLGQVYYDGEGVTQDYKEAARWWLLSSDANSHSIKKLGVFIIWEICMRVEEGSQRTLVKP